MKDEHTSPTCVAGRRQAASEERLTRRQMSPRHSSATVSASIIIEHARPHFALHDSLLQDRSGLQIYGGPGSLSQDFKIWPIAFQGSGPSGPIFLVVKKSHFNENIHLTAILRTPQNSCQYSKKCLKQPLKIRQNKDLNNK